MDADPNNDIVSMEKSQVQESEKENIKRDEGVQESLKGDSNEPVEWVEEDSEEDEARSELGIVIRIWTRRSVNQSAFVTTMTNIWQMKAEVEIKNIGKNMYVVQFHHWKDKERVMEGQPWHFDRHVILMTDIQGKCKPSDIQLWEFPIWARVYDLPFKGRLNDVNVRAIGNKIGAFIKMDNSGAMGIDKSVRIRVLHDVRKSLVSCVKVKLKTGKEEEFEVKYERPPLFCFFCGRVGHGTKDCDEEDAEEEGEIKFGGWLKASPWKVGDMGERGKGKVGEKSCARALFITKPKEKIRRNISEEVNDVVLSLDKWDLKEPNKGIDVEGDKGKNENNTQRGNGEDADGGRVTSKGDDIAGILTLNQEKELVEGLTTREVVYGRKVKIWRKKDLHGSTNENETERVVGCKRDEREGMVNGLDAMEIEERRYLKRVSLVESEAMETMHCVADEKVAGPTEWTLSAQ